MSVANPEAVWDLRKSQQENHSTDHQDMGERHALPTDISSEKPFLACYEALAETKHLTRRDQVIMEPKLPIMNQVLSDPNQ